MPRREDGGLLIFGTGPQTKYVLEICAVRGHPVAGVVGEFATGEEREDSGWPRWAGAYDAPLLDATAAAACAAAPGGPRNYIACHSNIARRREAARQAEALGLFPAICVHPAAIVASTAAIGSGSIVNPGAVLQPFASVGKMCMIHAQAVIEHDAVLGDGVNVARGCAAGWRSARTV